MNQAFEAPFYESMSITFSSRISQQMLTMSQRVHRFANTSTSPIECQDYRKFHHEYKTFFLC